MSFKLNIYKYFLVIVILFGILLSAYNIWIPYSYWWDELYSVTASILPLNQLFSEYVFHDVHPPLHQLTLKAWMGVFGTSEFATRSLSLTFSWLALLSIFVIGRSIFNQNHLLTIAAIFVSTYLFSFYSQETRSYSMMLFFSTALSLYAIKLYIKESKQNLIGVIVFAALLSLTHFFGFIYAGLTLLILLFLVKNLKNKTFIVFAGISLLIWPVVHFLLGDLSSKTGGNFWIKSDGIQTTIYTYFTAIMPQAAFLKKIFGDIYFQYLISFFGITSIILFSYLALKNYSSKSSLDTNNKKALFFSGVIIAIFATIVALVDLYSPISTSRNYIVLLPISAVLLSIILTCWSPNKVLAQSLIGLIVMSSLAVSVLKIKDKQTPLQNHISSSKFMAEKLSVQNFNIYHLGTYPATSGFAYVQNNMAKFYLEKILKEHISITPVSEENIYNLPKPFLLFSQHRKVDTEEIVSNFKKKGINVEVFEPKQVHKNSSVVIYAE